MKSIQVYPPWDDLRPLLDIGTVELPQQILCVIGKSGYAVRRRKTPMLNPVGETAGYRHLETLRSPFAPDASLHLQADRRMNRITQPDAFSVKGTGPIIMKQRMSMHQIHRAMNVA
jgi:hypothetical protein